MLGSQAQSGKAPPESAKPAFSSPRLQTGAASRQCPPMAAVTYLQIKDTLRSLYLDDPRPWLVGFSVAKDSTALLQLVCVRSL
jgi:hypothetical protein